MHELDIKYIFKEIKKYHVHITYTFLQILYFTIVLTCLLLHQTILLRQYVWMLELAQEIPLFIHRNLVSFEYIYDLQFELKRRVEDISYSESLCLCKIIERNNGICTWWRYKISAEGTWKYEAWSSKSRKVSCVHTYSVDIKQSLRSATVLILFFGWH